MLNEIYVTQNRNRTRPCVQSRMDMFRIFKYDINSAAEMSNRTQPLLMTRHNVVPGMFLVSVYCTIDSFNPFPHTGNLQHAILKMSTKKYDKISIIVGIITEQS